LSPCYVLLVDSLGFERSHFTQPAKMPLSLAELRCHERVDQVSSHSRSNGPTAHTDDVHVVVLDTLLGREVIVNQTGADARDLVRTDRRATPLPQTATPRSTFPSATACASGMTKSG
jgi:hypothetical protein